DYYHHSPGEVLEHLLPTMLRRGCGLSEADERGWESNGQEPAKPLRGSKQQDLWALFQQQPQQLHADLTAQGFTLAQLRSLSDAGVIRAIQRLPIPPVLQYRHQVHSLNAPHQQALKPLSTELGH